MRLLIPLCISYCLLWLSPTPEEYPCFFNESIKWKLISYKNLKLKTETGRPWRYHKFFEVILQFDYDEQINGGTFEGQSLSNIVAGRYKLTEEGISITHFEDSQMREPAWGLDSMHIAMRSVSSFSCNGDTMLLKYANNSHAMVFVKTETPFYDWDEYLREMAGSSSID